MVGSKVMRVGVFSLLAAGTTFPAAAADSPLAQRLDGWLTESEYRGVVLVAKDGKVVLEKGYGLSDREAGIPFGPATVFTVGSITKQFTAAAILKLEMQGKLRVEDPISKHVPGVPEDKKNITIHHLLTHTSGLSSDFAGDFDKAGRDEYVRLILASTLRSAPGAEYFYANSGYSLLGGIVEIVSGRPFEAFLQDNLFAPAGMKQTGYRLPKWEKGREAVGYQDGERWGRLSERPWADDGPYWALRANGGMLSTVDDLLLWNQALQGDAVLSEEARRKLFTPHVAEGPGADSYYGYGWAISESPWGSREIGHNGGNGVFSADFRRFPDDGLVVITAANDSSVKAWRAAGALARLAHGDAAPTAVPAHSGSLSPLGNEGRHATARAWFDAYHSDDPDAMESFRRKFFSPPTGKDSPSPEQRAAMLQRVHDDLGRIEPEGIVSEDDDVLVVRGKSERGMPARFRFVFEAGKVQSIGIEVGD